jgi:2-iminobutanoate/2-iminopropanoate deaminase
MANHSNQPITTDAAPKAIGPYSQAVRAGDLLFCSGQIALDPASGQLIGRDAAEQCRRVMQNLGAVLAAGGTDWSQVVRTTIFLADIDDFAAVNEIYAQFLGPTKPARATVAVRTLPRNALVEIDCIARVPR